MPSIQRIQKINEEVLRELSRLVHTIKDPRVQGIVSLTRVETTRDLYLARVFVSVLGDNGDVNAVMAGLKSAAGYLRRELASALSLRHTPELQFIEDDSLSHGAKIQQILATLQTNDDPAAVAEPKNTIDME